MPAGPGFHFPAERTLSYTLDNVRFFMFSDHRKIPESVSMKGPTLWGNKKACLIVDSKGYSGKCIADNH